MELVAAVLRFKMRPGLETMRCRALLWVFGGARQMPKSHDQSCRQCGGRGRGLLTGAIAATALTLGRKIAAQSSIGKGHSLKHRALDLAAGVMQQKYPLDAMSTYLNGFHFYADDMGRQVEAHHFCTHLTADMHQCVIYDSNRAGARLIGIEYIISKQRFERLPEEERRLWHSHDYEVRSGELIAPGIPEMAEHSYFEDLVTTYGKTWHTWQIDRDDFPLGIPQLMMGFTGDGQIDQAMIDARDRRTGIRVEERRRNREDIPQPALVPGCNPWESGHTVQTRLEEMDFENGKVSRKAVG